MRAMSEQPLQVQWADVNKAKFVGIGFLLGFCENLALYPFEVSSFARVRVVISHVCRHAGRQSAHAGRDQHDVQGRHVTVGGCT